MSSRAIRAKQARISAGLRQTDAAEKLNKSVSTIKSWEQEGGSEPGSLEDVSRLCALYGISIDYYINGTEYRSLLSKADTELLHKIKALPDKTRQLMEDLVDELS